MKKIFITGISGQDGSYMSEYCLKMDDTMVFGMVRRTSQPANKNFRHLENNPCFQIVKGDLLDASSLNNLVEEIQPDYFINFAAQSFVADSWKIPEETFMATAVGVLKCLEAIRNRAPKCRFYNAGSSEQFGDVLYSPQDEIHPFRPRSPYGAAKCSAHHLVKVYRESYNLYAVQGMLFNHESERRGGEFVTRKITKGFAKIAKAIKEGKDFEPIHLGNIDAKRDWSHASDFMDAVWKMLNQDIFNKELLNMPSEELPKYIKEYVIASGECHTVRDFINILTHHLDYDCFWNGIGIQEKLLLNSRFMQQFKIHNPCLVTIDPSFYRPADVNKLMGNPARAISELGWTPKISFDTLAKRMLEYDLYESGIISITNDSCSSPSCCQKRT